MNVPELIERFTDELHAAREAEELLVTVSLTLPEWNHDRARELAPAFGERLQALGARGLLMALDRRKDTGASHWHGIAIIPEEPSRREAKVAVAQAWCAVACASLNCTKITTMSGWEAFVESEGDFDAMAGMKSFRGNVAGALSYSFKPWSVEHGVRDLETDVFAIGCFSSWNEPFLPAAPAAVSVVEEVEETGAVDSNTLTAENEAEARTPGISPCPQREEGGARVPTTTPIVDGLASEVEGIGTVFGSPSRRTHPPRLPEVGVPPFPGASVLPPAVIPMPPTLDPKASPITWATTLATLYRNAIVLEFGPKHPEAKFAFTRGEITNAKHFKLLVGAARFMIANEVRPAEWCVYSCRAWRGAGKPAPVAWVFGTKGLAAHLERFKREMGDGVGNRSLLLPKARALLERWGEMRRELVDLEYPTKAAVHRVVERHARPYERMLEDARREIEEEEAVIKARVDAGDLTLWFEPARASSAK